jgi:hypothetical protein
MRAMSAAFMARLPPVLSMPAENGKAEPALAQGVENGREMDPGLLRLGDAVHLALAAQVRAQPWWGGRRGIATGADASETPQDWRLMP